VDVLGECRSQVVHPLVGLSQLEPRLAELGIELDGAGVFDDRERVALFSGILVAALQVPAVYTIELVGEDVAGDGVKILYSKGSNLDEDSLFEQRAGMFGKSLDRDPRPAADIIRDALNTASQADVIVAGLPANGDHPMHPFVVDSSGNLFMDVGSATNSCQVKNRTLESPGRNPCTELRTRAGIWRYDANKTGQKFSPIQPQ